MLLHIAPRFPGCEVPISTITNSYDDLGSLIFCLSPMLTPQELMNSKTHLGSHGWYRKNRNPPSSRSSITNDLFLMEYLDFRKLTSNSNSSLSSE